MKLKVFGILFLIVFSLPVLAGLNSIEIESQAKQFIIENLKTNYSFLATEDIKIRIHNAERFSEIIPTNAVRFEISQKNRKNMLKEYPVQNAMII